MARAAEVAYADAGVDGHERMNIAEVLIVSPLPNLMCKPSTCVTEAAATGSSMMVTQINGRIPVNTGGGLLGFGHPSASAQPALSKLLKSGVR